MKNRVQSGWSKCHNLGLICEARIAASVKVKVHETELRAAQSV